MDDKNLDPAEFSPAMIEKFKLVREQIEELLTIDTNQLSTEDAEEVSFKYAKEITELFI